MLGWLARWIEANRAGAWSRSTIRNTWNWARRFARFLRRQYRIDSLEQLTPTALQAYREDRLMGLALSSQNREMSYLVSFFRWCVDQGLLLSSPVAGWRYFDLPLPALRLLLPAQIQAVLRAIDTRTPDGIQDRALVETFYATAMRLSELTALDLHDVDLRLGTVWIRHGKGDKGRLLPLIPSALWWIGHYLKQGRGPLVKSPVCQALFIGKAGGRISPAHVHRLMKRLRQLTGVEPLSSHTLRHSCATHLMEADVPLPYIQAFLGHSQISTTQRYLHLLDPQLKQNYNAAHPRDKWAVAVQCPEYEKMPCISPLPPV